MGQSYRIKTEIGINKSINVSFEQDFEFLEILSLQIQQTDVYTRSCAEYGVVVGRVTANNGFGIPNARISVFVPLLVEDESNPIITSIYPYKSPEDKNEDGYRYNLLPYEKSYSAHAATGTLPSRLDVLTDPTAVQVYDKYYKLTVKTNESGDYMIMGVPLGTRKLFMDVDLSDIGEFSLTPQDLIRMGLATESQVAGNRFRTSNDLNSLPQIITIQKDIEVLPLWGDPEICQIAITRTDFDLRDDANVDIQPTSVFMGSIYSSPDKFRVRPGIRVLGVETGGCKPKDDLGNLCNLVAGPGQILAIRQTIEQDSEGNPILEQYQLEQSGNIIDGDGTWLTELPMNLDYVITNEFGEKVLSSDPTLGIPTKSKYRFKIKWQQPPTLTEQTRRGYYLVPNVKEYGWDSPNADPSYLSPTSSSAKKQNSSYYFGLEWSGYTEGFNGQSKLDRLNEIINCEDTFFEFQFNRVYTVSGLIDQWKKGGRGRFIGIKEIDDDSCSNSVNKFPVNDGFRSFDFLFFLFSLLLTVIQPILLVLVLNLNIILGFINIIIRVLCTIGQIPGFGFIRRALPCQKNIFTIRLGMITYPECSTCDCEQTYKTTQAELIENSSVQVGGALTYFSLPETYIPAFDEYFSAKTLPSSWSLIFSESVAGRASQGFIANPFIYKTPLSQNIRLDDDQLHHTSSKDLPLGERINVFNTRKNYFDGANKIKVKVEPKLNVGSDKYHYDNTIIVISNTPFQSGDVLTSVDINKSTDLNWKYSAVTNNGLITGISGQSLTTTATTNVSITYASTPTTPQTVVYSLPYGVEQTNYKFPADIEYMQVVTAVTWGEISKVWNPSTIESFPNILYAPTNINLWKIDRRFLASPVYEIVDRLSINPIDYIDGIENQYVVVLQRGVDPYSPKYEQQYSLGNLFGTDENDTTFIVTANTRLNIPIQINTNLTTSIQGYNQTEMFHNSYFFRPGIDGSTENGLVFSAFTTENTGYYSYLDADNLIPPFLQESGNQVLTKISNGFYNASPSGAKYDLSEDLTGSDGLGCNNYSESIGTKHPSQNYETFFGYENYTRTFYVGSGSPKITISDKEKIILRTDRLPSSDQLDGGGWDNNPSLLQQNLNFNFYLIDVANADITSSPVSLGAQQTENDIIGLPDSGKVLDSFNCNSMVSLNCYSGFGNQFQIDEECAKTDGVEKGCYTFLKNPPFDIFKDLNNISEWAYRFRFFYGLCRGILSQSFVNNWMNGSLYAFPIQVDTFYDKQNKPFSKYCKDLIYFDNKTINFYYRSSPYNDNTNRFVGKPTSPSADPTNKYNLLYPTTIINLGMKDNFYGELSFDPSTRAYVMTELNDTTYGDTTDLINLFVISRITDDSFLKRLITIGKNAGINQLFSRPKDRIDGDLAQLMSINSELGVIKFSPEFYEIDDNGINNPTNILGSPSKPTIAVWYSSTTENLQTKDYLTPGRIDFRATPTSNFSPFNYGIKTQVVPFYKWELKGGTTIFGTQDNNWVTQRENLVAVGYQSLDRVSITQPTFFQNNAPTITDLNKRGYIFNVDQNDIYSSTGALFSSFIVGAPFHFYFGTVKGKSALDKFKTKYSIVE